MLDSFDTWIFFGDMVDVIIRFNVMGDCTTIMGIILDADWYGIIILYDLMNSHKVEMYHQVVLHF